MLVWVATTFTFGSGVASFHAVLGPDQQEHLRLLHRLFPLELFDLSRSLTLLTGFALVLSSVHIYKRKRRALWAVMSLATVSACVHVFRSFHGLSASEHGEEFLISVALIGVLWCGRHSFTVRSRATSWRDVIGRLVLATTAAMAYGIVGFWLLQPTDFGVNFDWRDSVHHTLVSLSLVGDLHLVPRTAYANWFLQSLPLITIMAVVYGSYALFRPALYMFRIQPQERSMALGIIAVHGRSAHDFFKGYPDKSYYFSPSRRAFLAYRVGANCALVLGDPVGPADEVAPLVSDFLNFCDDNDWCVGFYQVLPDYLDLYQRLGLKRLKAGDDGIVDLRRFSLEGSPAKALRRTVNRLERMGVRVEYHEPTLSSEFLEELRSVSDEWLRIPGRRERQFTLGRFEPEYLRSTPVLTASTASGVVLAFVNVVPSYRPGEATIDLLRRRRDAPNGIMDYLLVQMFLLDKRQGFERFNLGMAPMAGYQEGEPASPEERAIHAFFQHLNFVFSFKGMRAYKAKFADLWEPRFVIYRHTFDLPRLALALARVSEIRA